jgi:class 3 adenylate cyclase
VVTNYEGFIEKFIGDAVVALFGVPQAHEDDPIRAIRAAREGK